MTDCRVGVRRCFSTWCPTRSRCLQGISEGSREAERQRGHRGGTQWSDGNTHASCRDRLERARRDSENKHSKSSPRPFQAILKKWNHKVTKAEENTCAERPLRGPRPSNRMGPHQEDSEFKALEFDSTLGYPGEGPPRVPDLGSMERCNSCDLAPWRVSRGGNAGKCEKCKNVRKRGTEMVKCRVCAHGGYARRVTTLRREESPPRHLQKLRHLDHGDHDDEMPDQNDTAEDDEMLHDGASLHILESLRELAKKNMPNTTTFIPHRMRKRFARVYSSKMNELASHMQRREDTLILSEDEASTELHKEHHSRSAGLNQRLAEGERDEWGGLIQRAFMKQQDDEERTNANSNQLEHKDQAYLRKVNRAIFKANNGCLRAAKQIMLGSKQASNSRRRNDKDDPGKTSERRLA